MENKWEPKKWRNKPKQFREIRVIQKSQKAKEQEKERPIEEITWKEQLKIENAIGSQIKEKGAEIKEKGDAKEQKQSH